MNTYAFLSLPHFRFGNADNKSIFFSAHEIGDPRITVRRIHNPANHLTWNFNKKQVYKQLALEQQIDKQLSRLNPLSLSNNKNHRLKNSGVSPLQ